MSTDLRIDFRLHGQTCHVDLQRSNGSQNAVVIGGISYSLQGNQEALRFVQNCFDLTHFLLQKNLLTI